MTRQAEYQSEFAKAMFTHAGAVLISSRDFARIFKVEHSAVLKCIDNIVAIRPLAREALRRGCYGASGSGDMLRYYDLERPIFELLGLALTGLDAFAFWEPIITGMGEEADEMQRKIPAADLHDPEQLLDLIAVYKGKRKDEKSAARRRNRQPRS